MQEGCCLPAAPTEQYGFERPLLLAPRHHPCQVLLLDEPTSALDSQTEAQVLSALEAAMVRAIAACSETGTCLALPAAAEALPAWDCSLRTTGPQVGGCWGMWVGCG